MLECRQIDVIDLSYQDIHSLSLKKNRPLLYAQPIVITMFFAYKILAFQIRRPIVRSSAREIRLGGFESCRAYQQYWGGFWASLPFLFVFLT